MLKRKQLYVIICCVAVLIISLVVVQLYWLRNAYRMQAMNFNEKVKRALSGASADIEKQLFSFNLYARSYIQPGEGVMILKKGHNDHAIPDTLPLFNIFPYADKPDTCFYSTNISYYNVLTMVDVTMRFEYRQADSVLDIPGRNKDLQYMTLQNYRDKLDDTASTVKRLQSVNIDSILHMALLKEGVNNAFAYGLKKKGDKGFDLVSQAHFAKQLELTPYQSLLFASRQFITPLVLCLYITNKENRVGNTLLWSLLASVFIICGLTVAFGYFFRVVLRQKKLSEMKNDFINNMTHEFMTPVTNISLALETLERSQKQQNSFESRMFGVIAAESAHLTDNINKVLQVAMLEKGDIVLDPSILDIHELINRVAKSFELSVQGKNGQFNFSPDATAYKVIADETHIINLFYNVIDNSVKYAGEEPLVITIRTGNANNKLWVSISDNGQGMSAEVERQIFNKFYRGSKGDVHDVKGFGLGLAYVKSIADAHHILIEVKSTLHKGTTFTLWFNI